jgi:D-threonine aldolase
VKIGSLATPTLVVAVADLEHNLRTMAQALPGGRLRPHVKAHKCSALAQRQAAYGHRGFTCATTAEMRGLAKAGLGDDLLLANEVLDVGRLRGVRRTGARITVAVDSGETIAAAAAAGIGEIVVDVNIGLPRCGCAPEDAGRLADAARARGLDVRGVMGYEGHAVGVEDRAQRTELVRRAMELLQQAADQVGGDVISAGGTGTYDINTVATEIQAGSYALMDSAYAKLSLPFRQAVYVLATVVSVSPQWAVADCGAKALGMDHGNPTIDGSEVWFCSDEHVTFAPGEAVRVGDRIRVIPSHVDPTVAYHARIHVIDDEDVVETWPVDLRGW